MKDLIITGASRGIGRALALAAAEPPALADRLILIARSRAGLEEVGLQIESRGRAAVCMPGDLSSSAEARALGERLAGAIQRPAVLVHNAGLWPSQRILTAEGIEMAFAVNCAGPLIMQQVLLEGQGLGRVMLISAGLLVKGRYSAERTPAGLDFSTWRTYCTTKLAFAVAEREIAAQHPEVDFVVLHPGVVQSDLGARRGVLGLVLKLTKRLWESPDTCAARLRALLERDRWSPPGNARWWFEDREQPWPNITEDAQTKDAIHQMMAKYLSVP